MAQPCAQEFRKKLLSLNKNYAIITGDLDYISAVHSFSMMSQAFGRLFASKPSHPPGLQASQVPSTMEAVGRKTNDQKACFSKVFRWHLPDGQTEAPATVEIVGTFTQWEKVPFQRDSGAGAWHLTLNTIPAHKTHHYMLLVDGKPVQDKNSDGMAVPKGPDEERFQLMTLRGPRVFMLFAQTK
jgi:hypothetical protein